jgi:addiction module HigA family antidote
VALAAIHPAQHLAEELKELEMSAAELARQLGVPTNRVTEILNGRRAITGDTALRLAQKSRRTEPSKVSWATAAYEVLRFSA